MILKVRATRDVCDVIVKGEEYVFDVPNRLVTLPDGRVYGADQISSWISNRACYADWIERIETLKD